MFATSQGTGGGFTGGGGGAGAGAAGATGAAPVNGTALFKSTDEGKTWTKVSTLPPYTGRISVAVAQHTNGQRLYVVGGALQGGSGLYRSDDQGATWKHMAGTDTRVSQRPGRLQFRRVGGFAESGHPVHGRDRGVPLDRRRQHVHLFQGRAGRRGSPRHLDRSDRRPSHAVRMGPGPDGHARWRRELEQLSTRCPSIRSTTSPPTRGTRTG